MSEDFKFGTQADDGESKPTGNKTPQRSVVRVTWPLHFVAFVHGWREAF